MLRPARGTQLALASLGLTGRELFEITGVAEGLTPGKQLSVRAVSDDGTETAFTVTCRIDTRWRRTTTATAASCRSCCAS